MSDQNFSAGKDFPMTIKRVPDGMQFTIRDMSVVLGMNRVQGVRDYLDMEFAPPFMAFGEVNILRVYQEDDGVSWFRVFHTDTREGRLSCLTDQETGQLYEWLNSVLDKV